MTSTDKASIVLLILGMVLFTLCLIKGKNALSVCCLLVSVGSLIMIIANKGKREE